MRRSPSRPLPEFLRSAPPESKPAAERSELRASIDLELITPLIGGGVDSFEPDSVDVVRVPSVRGQLRWWWRALYAGETPDPEELFVREASLWGGVSVPLPAEKGEAKEQALASRVRIAVEVLDPGKVLPAGEHDASSGRVKAFARWTIGSRLGYALFPLQRSQEERRDFHGAGAMPTRSVRIDVRFRLHLSVAAESAGSAQPTTGEQALAALWAWVFFGGLGARTRRGFGALKPSGALELAGLSEERRKAWAAAFTCPRPAGVDSWLAGWAKLAHPAFGRFVGGRLLRGTPTRRAVEAHEKVVDLLCTFRQGVGTGRDAGDRRPGQSRWPEAHLVRRLRLEEKPTPHFEHPPPQDLPQDTGAPRAAFGLPIQLHFKDRGDQAAGATLNAPRPGSGDGVAGRWSSPLLLRPLPLDGKDYLPIALVLGGDGPANVHVTFDGNKDPSAVVRVRSAAGARPPINRALQQAEGDALGAFALWLVREQRFTEGTTTGRGSSRG